MKYILPLLLLSNLAMAQVNFQSSNLPILVIDAVYAIIDEPKREADMGIIYNGVGQRNHLSDAFNEYNGKIGIELRGQSSQFFFDKKSYGIETRDTLGDNFNVSLLGMPEENDWILYGPYSDKTLMRNTLMYQLSNEVGQYASRTKFVELVLNGEYLGVYVLMEKIKRDKNRIDIAKLDKTKLGADDITGGYILRLDKYDIYDTNIFSSEFTSERIRMDYQVVYPKSEDLDASQYEYIKNYIYELEEALTGLDFQDPNVGFRKYMDVPSFIDYILLNELARNPDAYRISTYFHKKNISEGGKLHMGPIWDFNIAMGNADFCLGSGHQNWVLNYNHSCPDDFWLIGFWWDKLLSDVEFVKQLQERWQELRATNFSLDNIYTIIDSSALKLNEAQDRNFTKYDILGEYIWPNDYIGGNYTSEIIWLKNWFAKRVNWMDNNIENISVQVKGSSSRFIREIYPNPVQNEMTIELQLEIEGEGEAKFTLMNTIGQVIAIMNLEPVYGINTKYRVPSTFIKQMSGGLYFYKLEITNGLTATGKFVKE